MERDAQGDPYFYLQGTSRVQWERPTDEEVRNALLKEARAEAARLATQAEAARVAAQAEALHKAAREGDMDVAALLLDRGAAIEAKDEVSRPQCAFVVVSMHVRVGRGAWWLLCRNVFRLE